MKARLPAIGLALLLIGLLALIANGTIGEAVVVPLLLLWWAVQVLYQSVHQALLWALFILLALLVVVRSFPGAGAPPVLATPHTVAAGRVADWARRLREAGRDDHSRWRLAQQISLLAFETLAFYEQSTPQEISRRLRDGALDVPPQVGAYLLAGSSAYVYKPRLRRRFGRPAAGDPLAIDPRLVLEYLEDTVQHTIGAAE